MSVRRRLVIGNWKMNGSKAENEQLLSDLVKLQNATAANQAAELAVCAPFPYLQQVADILKDSAISWGGQDVSEHAKGAYTGEVSVAMLAEFGCAWAIVGHSERRAYHGEGSDVVARKAAAAIAGGITPVVCVGETQAEREASKTLQVISSQLEPVLALGADRQRRRRKCMRTSAAYWFKRMHPSSASCMAAASRLQMQQACLPRKILMARW